MLTINIPFFFGAQDESLNILKPQILPFHYFYNKDLKLFQQKSTHKLDKLLLSVYKEGSMMNGEMDFNDGGLQGQAALDFILQNIGGKKYLTILEIGCGNGFLLKELHKKSYLCVGLEPGPQSRILSEKYPEMHLINDFFPSKHLTDSMEKFDVILHFNVIEHIKDPIAFLEEHKKLLNKSGIIIFGVPNCEPNLMNGDNSIFLHEHFNYFTRDSLVEVAKKIGLKIHKLKTGANNGMIFCSMMSDSQSKYQPSNYPWQTFNTKKYIQNIKIEIEKYNEVDIAIYCPIRAMNVLSMINAFHCRLIDDTPTLFNKYIPPLKSSVENFASLVDRPPKLIIIFSRTFGKEIFAKCRSNVNLMNTKILLIENFI